MDNNLQTHPKLRYGVDEDVEDEMLNYQELFHRSNMQPSAQVIREPKVKRQQSNENEEKKKKLSNIDLTETTVMRPIIIERDVSTTPIQLPKPVDNPFPQATHRGAEDDLEKISLPNVKKASLFAKQMYRDGRLKACKELEEKKVLPTTENVSRSTLITGVGLSEVTGERELQRIHEENFERLKSMNEKEILAEKEKLLKTLDPKLIAFIRNKSKKETVKETISIERETFVDKMETDNQTDLPIEIDSRWMHMENIEREKLQWMKDLPKPSAQQTTDDSKSEGVPARFDFKGNLLPRNADIPVTAALHHHGDEPEVAGYTLEELFHLSRSTVLQQRSIALQTLANIIRQAHTGVYDVDLQLPLIPKLIEAGIVFLIRWAMDEQIESIYMIAIECLANLIAPRKDEENLSQTSHWPCGYYQPNLTPPDIDLGEKKSESDLTDIEILEQDVIKCLFRMNILKRLVYLLDRMKLLSTSMDVQIPVRYIFQILIRMARHSMSSANQIFEEKQLMNFIIREFIPEIALSNNEGRVYECLLPDALKFLGVLASHGSTLSYNLIYQYGLNQRLRNHLVFSVSQPSSLESNSTLVELLSLWKVFIFQGHLADEFGLLLPTTILPLCRISIQQMPNERICQILVQLITLVDSVIIYITKFISKHRNSTDNLITNSINWSHIDGLFDIILTIGKQTLIEIDEKFDFDALRTACLSCLASFLIGQQLLSINLLDLPPKVQLIRQQFFEPIVSLRSTKHLIENLPFESARISTNSTQNLPALTQINLSPFGYLIALLRLTKIFYQIDKNLSSSKYISQLMLTKNSEIVVYMKKILNKLTSTNTRKASWFEQFEHVFIFEFIQIIHCEKSENDLPSIYYEILLALLPSLLKGYQYLAQEIFKFIFFDQFYWKRPNNIDLSDLSLIPNESLCLASNESLTITSSHRSLLYDRAVEHLPSLYTYYKKLLHINQTLVDLNISDIHIGNTFQNEDLFKLTQHYSNTFIDLTWPYGLLPSLYTNALTIPENNQRLEIILNTLKFVYILEMKNCLSLKKILTKTTRFSMIAAIYLLQSDVFLEKNIAEYLVAFLNHFHQENLLQQLQTNTTIQSFMTFFDFYRSLIDQYEACSFGDVLFSNYILVPIQQIYDVYLRKHFWIEHSTTLKYLRLKPDQIFYSIETFFLPYETDIELIRYYFQILIKELITKSNQPFLYMIAIHHVNAFLYDQKRTDQLNLQKMFVKNLQTMAENQKSLYNDILNYKTFSKDGPVIFENLPTIRVSWLDKLLK